MFDLSGKVAVITGAAGGLGTAFAEGMAEAGADVVCGDIDEAGAKELAEKITKLGRRAISVKCDVTQESDAAELMNRAVEAFGRIDILFNNAGIADKEPKRIHEYPTDDWNRVLGINLQGVFYCSREALKVMVQQKSGRVINIGSTWGIVGSSSIVPVPAYCATKGAVVNLTREIALEYASQGITVNAICPGFFVTNIAGGALYKDQDALKRVLEYIPMQRVAQPWEIKGAAIFLASEAGAYVTGTSLVIDGGITAR
ncbi:MAG TPA: SDR family NAD(P)-dependent oxidoreductase [Acidobacteriaceae bacterium]|jgi:NAD(P)-dependent dehydrogenase (short-subunit alcohol dehydrogenase family)